MIAQKDQCCFRMRLGRLMKRTALLLAFAVALSALGWGPFRPQPAQAEWPPFSFRLTPSYDQGQITYQLKLSNRLEGPLTDVLIKIPLPQGTRFLSAAAPPGIYASFDGAEVTFFTTVVHSSLKGLTFTVEVIDPAQTVFAARAWLKWGGEMPGDYLTDWEEIDLGLPPLLWEKPEKLPLQLEARATTAGDGIITYDLYPTNVTGKRVWDVRVSLPLPAGATPLSIEAPPTFVSGFGGGEVTFATLELESRTEVGPLRVTVETPPAGAALSTYAWGDWKNVSKKAPAWQATQTADLPLQPSLPQLVVADRRGDVPFANYDLTAVALQEAGSHLVIVFYTAGPIAAGQSPDAADPLEYAFYLDRDCRAETGRAENKRGVEYRLRYRSDRGETSLDAWDTTAEKWRSVAKQKDELAPEEALLHTHLYQQAVEIWLPRQLIDTPENPLSGTEFCWTAEAKNRTKAFRSKPPTDKIPNSNDPRLTRYRLSSDE